MAPILIVGPAGRLAPKWAGSIPQAHASWVGEQRHSPANAIMGHRVDSGVECVLEKIVGCVRHTWWGAGTTFELYNESTLREVGGPSPTRITLHPRARAWSNEHHPYDEKE